MSDKTEVTKTEKAEMPKYRLTAKEYRPKATHNIVAWERVKKALSRAPKTLEQLQHALEYTDEEMAESRGEGKLTLKQQAHHDFIGYMERGGYIEMVKGK